MLLHDILLDYLKKNHERGLHVQQLNTLMFDTIYFHEKDLSRALSHICAEMLHYKVMPLELAENNIFVIKRKGQGSVTESAFHFTYRPMINEFNFDVYANMNRNFQYLFRATYNFEKELIGVDRPNPAMHGMPVQLMQKGVEDTVGLFLACLFLKQDNRYTKIINHGVNAVNNLNALQNGGVFKHTFKQIEIPNNGKQLEWKMGSVNEGEDDNPIVTLPLLMDMETNEEFKVTLT